MCQLISQQEKNQKQIKGKACRITTKFSNIQNKHVCFQECKEFRRCTLNKMPMDLYFPFLKNSKIKQFKYSSCFSMSNRLHRCMKFRNETRNFANGLYPDKGIPYSDYFIFIQNLNILDNSNSSTVSRDTACFNPVSFLICHYRRKINKTSNWKGTLSHIDYEQQVEYGMKRSYQDIKNL